jgi:hypothetical protein
MLPLQEAEKHAAFFDGRLAEGIEVAFRFHKSLAISLGQSVENPHTMAEIVKVGMDMGGHINPNPNSGFEGTFRKFSIPCVLRVFSSITVHCILTLLY